ncbi:MAG: hypothetical protein HPY81_00685 [Firmicutes bacterium]|nr:hypothetical protein [Bacillota bacterium]
MAQPVIDDSHHELRRIVQKISYICTSDEFQALKKELETLYRRYGTEQPAISAFQDALYTLLVQEEIDLLRSRAY